MLALGPGPSHSAPASAALTLSLAGPFAGEVISVKARAQSIIVTGRSPRVVEGLRLQEAGRGLRQHFP
eukprot:15438858-Alexandrium_andersonii.AAC.1